MNIQMDDMASVTSVVIATLVCLTILGMNGCVQEHKTTRAKIEAGMEQVQQAGGQSTMWVYPKGNQ